MQKQKRNPGIEVYRIALMFGICLLHAITQGGHNNRYLANMLLWCVPGFVFISGWFGIRFSWKKMFGLYGISLYCAAMFCGVDYMLGSYSGGGVQLLSRIWAIAKGQWFLNAYLILMCFAPILNEACESLVTQTKDNPRKLLKLVAPILLCAFGWSFLTGTPIGRFVPGSAGLTAYSFLTMIGAYLIARLWHLCEDAGCLRLTTNNYQLMTLLLLSLALASIGFGRYNSPIAILIAAITFHFARKASIPSAIGRIATILAPSMFSIYLIHSHSGAFVHIARIETLFAQDHIPVLVIYVVTAIIIFCGCMLLDLPRRTVKRLIEMRLGKGLIIVNDDKNCLM